MCESKISVKVVIRNPQGLHARPAQIFSERALQFKATIVVVKDNVDADAKSIMHLLSLGAGPNSEITISAEGEDAQEALDTLAALIDENFGLSNDEEEE